MLFYNSLRHGMSYANPGAFYCENRHRQRVLANIALRGHGLNP